VNKPAPVSLLSPPTQPKKHGTHASLVRQPVLLHETVHVDDVPPVAPAAVVLGRRAVEERLARQDDVGAEAPLFDFEAVRQLGQGGVRVAGAAVLGLVLVPGGDDLFGEEKGGRRRASTGMRAAGAELSLAAPPLSPLLASPLLPLASSLSLSPSTARARPPTRTGAAAAPRRGAASASSSSSPPTRPARGGGGPGSSPRPRGRPGTRPGRGRGAGEGALGGRVRGGTGKKKKKRRVEQHTPTQNREGPPRPPLRSPLRDPHRGRVRFSGRTRETGARRRCPLTPSHAVRAAL
jgi:hypothetical protein